MKGTLFSADFAVDSSDNLRLLEINTDTGISSASLSLFDYTPLHDILNSGSFTDVTVVYKDHQANFVDHLSASLTADYTGSITAFTRVIEEGNTIYPSFITDGEDKFIIRLAYDESAILDSTYAKNNLNILELFVDNGDSGSIANYYYSGSEGIVDNLERTFNSSVMPDIVVKDTTTTMYQPLSFYKIGHSSSGSDDRYTNFINEIKTSDTLIQNYYENLDGDKQTSIRSYSIVYGANLDLATIGYTQTDAVLEKPTSIESSDANISNLLGMHHYFEFATNTPVFGVGNDYGGIFEEEEIVSQSGDIISIVSASVGKEFKSYFISGSPDSDVASEYLGWSHAGSDLPSGSFITSSTMINNVRLALPYGIIFNLTPSGSNSVRMSGASAILVYDINGDHLKYETLVDVNPNAHKLINSSGSTVDIVSNEAEVLSGSYYTHVVDLEETDTFFLADETTHLKIVTHNCLTAETLITMADGSEKRIDEVEVGDKLYTFNPQTQEYGESTIGGINCREVGEVTVIYYGDGKMIRTTPLHTFMVRGKGFIAAKDIEETDALIGKEGEYLDITSITTWPGNEMVFRLDDVAGDYTYFANGALVHNWKCFTYDSQVEMFDGTTKAIGEVVKGDEVKSFRNGEYVKGIVTEALTHPTEAVVDVCKFENMIAEPRHPVYVDGEWTTFEKIAKVEQMYITNWYNLEVDGHDVEGSEHNFIVDGHIVSGLGDNDVLNTVYNRQNLQPKAKLV